ncbi:MAG TPA: hypothetical protein VH640_31865 [Bryobacteraceae bacterium]
METQTAVSLSFLAAATDGIIKETVAALHAIPRRGAEMGGVLVGHYEEDRIVVEDFEPVACEHRWGPLYRLSERDLRGLEEALQRPPSTEASRVAVGFCRSDIRLGTELDEHDRDLFERYFPDTRAVFLVLKTERLQPMEATYFARTESALSKVAGPLPFPVEGAVALFLEAPVAEAKAEPAMPQPVEAAEPVADDGNGAANSFWPPEPPPRRIPPPTRPRLTAPSLTIADEARPPRDRRWLAIVAVLCGAAGIFGFWSLDLGRKPAPELPVAAPAAVAPKETAPSPPVAPRPAEQPPAPKPRQPLPDLMLSQWEKALHSGNPNAIAAFYAPRVESYFGERNVSRAAVARSLERSAQRYGKTEVLRVSNMRVTPLGDDRSAVTFRKQWQTSGRHVYTGETEERLILANSDDGWKIVSEQETRVLWTRRSR